MRALRVAPYVTIRSLDIDWEFMMWCCATNKLQRSLEVVLVRGLQGKVLGVFVYGQLDK